MWLSCDLHTTLSIAALHRLRHLDSLSPWREGGLHETKQPVTLPRTTWQWIAPHPKPSHPLPTSPIWFYSTWSRYILFEKQQSSQTNSGHQAWSFALAGLWLAVSPRITLTLFKPKTAASIDNITLRKVILSMLQAKVGFNPFLTRFVKRSGSELSCSFLVFFYRDGCWKEISLLYRSWRYLYGRVRRVSGREGSRNEATVRRPDELPRCTERSHQKDSGGGETLHSK